MKHLFEYVNFKPDRKETKKPRGYYKKALKITKMDLEQICDLLKLPFNELEYLGSGSFGDAYKVEDKVIKVTTDKIEARSVYNLLKNKNLTNLSVIKYYSINMWRKQGYEYCYVILMDYVESLDDYILRITKNKYNDCWNLINDILNVIDDNWRKIKNKQDFIKKIKNEETEKLKISSGLRNHLIDKFWDLYLDVEELQGLDLHTGNLGIKNGDFVLFDFREFKPISKFDLPTILK